MHEEPCMRCQGKGSLVCEECPGKRKIRTEMVTEKCKACNGTGRVKCPSCRGGVAWVKD